MQNEPIEMLTETNEDKALSSILDEAKRARREPPNERPAGVKPLEAEARVLDGRQDPKLLPDRAFAVLDAISYLRDASYSDRTIVEDFVFRSLQAGWPANADGLTEALMDRDGCMHFFNRLPLDLASCPPLTSAVTNRLLSNPSHQDMVLAKRLRFGDNDLRLLIHQASRSPKSEVSRLIPDLLKLNCPGFCGDVFI